MTSETPISVIAPPVPSGGLPYRPDIDGLRAVAVIAVILYHAFPDTWQGGFVGVDIFFVISGFLISGIILHALRSGDFSFSAFYSRRIRRIFPALFVVLAFCLALGWYSMAPGEWRRLVKNVIGGVAFASNLLQSRALGYFDSRTRTEPLLHLWSLGIEEQFYLVWPLVLVLLWKLDDRWNRGEKVLSAILLLAGASFAFDIEILYPHASLAFFHPLSRMWELLAGAALAMYTIMYGEVERRLHRELMCLTGVLLVVAALWLISTSTPVPGWWSLLPVLGAVFLLRAGSQAWFNRCVLSWRPLVAIGLISYPLYLWHWPLLAFEKLIADSDFDLTHRQDQADTVSLLLLALLLAWATYRFVETPMRFSSRLTSPFRVRLLVAAMVIIGLLAALGRGPFPPRLHSPVIREMELVRSDGEFRGNLGMLPLTTYDILSTATHSTLLVGDSHMDHYIARAEAAIKADPHLASAIFATSARCPALPGMNPVIPGYQCPAFYDYWKGLASQPRFSTVAISTYWESYAPVDYPLEMFHGHVAMAADYEEAWKGLAADLRLLVKAGKRVVFFDSSPASRKFDPARGFHRLPFLGLVEVSAVPRAQMESILAPVSQRLKAVASYAGAELISTRDYLCTATECPALDTDGSPIYYDGGHIRDSKAKTLATFVDDVLRP